MAGGPVHHQQIIIDLTKDEDDMELDEDDEEDDVGQVSCLSRALPTQHKKSHELARTDIRVSTHHLMSFSLEIMFNLLLRILGLL